MALSRGPHGRKATNPFDLSVRYLAGRARTVWEVRRYLSGRGHEPDDIEETLGRLRQLGYLDDTAFAGRFLEWASTERPMGRERIVHELARRGVPKDTAQAALSERFNADDEALSLARALSKLTRSRKTPLDEKGTRRLVSRLMRRGFAQGKVMEALRQWEAGWRIMADSEREVEGQ